MKLLAWLLNMLPFNGSKTQIGAWLTSMTALYALLQELDPELVNKLIELFTTKPINWAAAGLLLIGLLHKWLKKKYPELAPKEWPQ